MGATGYKLLGFVVWRGARWYVRRNYGHLVPSRRTAAAAGTGVLVVAAALVLAGRRGDA